MIRSLSLVLSLGLVGTSSLLAQPKLQWSKGPSLAIDLADILSPQQKKLLFSGFNTFSHLEVRLRDPGTSSRSLLFIGECTIQYDLWEEKFHLLHFLERDRPDRLLSFDAYTDLCLSATIRRAQNLELMQKPGAHLEITLDLAQVSNEFAKEVRSWLIQQQAGVMRGLFGHMLGDLKIYESVQLDLPVPPSPEKERQGSTP